MSSVKIKAALETALATILPALPSAPENVGFTPTVETAWQGIAVLFADPESLDMHNGANREQGIFQVSLHYPKNQGTGEQLARAELIRDLFHRGASFTSGGVDVIIERKPEISSGFSDGSFWTVPVKIRFYSNIA